MSRSWLRDTRSLPPPADWRSSAACLGEDPELWFPIGQTSPDDVRRTRKAKAICRRCPVRETCLEWALENADHGIFGGLTEDERRAVKQPQGKPKASMRDDSRAPYTWDDLHDLMRTGVPVGQWAKRLGTTPAALIRRLDRHDRNDLSCQVERATRREGAA